MFGDEVSLDCLPVSTGEAVRDAGDKGSSTAANFL